MRPLLFALPAVVLLCFTPSRPALAQDKKPKAAEEKIDFLLGKAYKLPSQYTNQESTYFSIIAGHDGKLYVGTAKYGVNAYLLSPQNAEIFQLIWTIEDHVGVVRRGAVARDVARTRRRYRLECEASARSCRTGVVRSNAMGDAAT